jgi:hypothetical protein
MPENIADTEKRQIRLTKSLIEQLELLALTGMYGPQLGDVVQTILTNEVRRLFASGELSVLRDRVKSYPAKPDENVPGRDVDKKGRD